MRLYNDAGERLYINGLERRRLLRVVRQMPLRQKALCQTLIYTGCRISEALELVPDRIDPMLRSITFRSLKKRDRLEMRDVPVPRGLIRVLVELIEETGCDAGQPLWREGQRPLSRSTAYRWVKSAMVQAGIEGPQACPKGLRHGFGVHAVQYGVQLNMVQKWMGHASMSTTALYTNAMGPEERAIARRMWTENTRP